MSENGVAKNDEAYAPDSALVLVNVHFDSLTPIKGDADKCVLTIDSILSTHGHELNLYLGSDDRTAMDAIDYLIGHLRLLKDGIQRKNRRSRMSVVKD